MPGGNKAIDGKVEGKQFSSDYQPKEKWTEQEALKILNELLDWLKEKTKKSESNNLFVQDFLVIEKDLSPTLFNYLSDKHSSVSRLYKKAKKIQEMKLVKLGLSNKFSATITKFVLTNHHNYRDKIDQKVIDAAPVVQIVDVRGENVHEDER